MSFHRTFSAAAIGAVLALPSAGASAQTSTGVGASPGTSAVIGAPGTVYGATVAPGLGVGGVATPGLGYSGTPLSIGYVSTPSTTSIGAGGIGATPTTPWLSPAYAGVSGTVGMPAGVPLGTTATTPAIGSFGVPGTTGSAAIDGYGSGLTTTGYASPPGTTPGVPFPGPAYGPGPGYGPAGPAYGGALGGSPYINEMYGVPGLIP